MDFNDVINEYMTQLTWISKVLAWMHLCLWLIINQENKKINEITQRQKPAQNSKIKKKAKVSLFFEFE